MRSIPRLIKDRSLLREHPTAESQLHAAQEVGMVTSSLEEATGEETK